MQARTASLEHFSLELETTVPLRVVQSCCASHAPQQPKCCHHRYLPRRLVLQTLTPESQPIAEPCCLEALSTDEQPAQNSTIAAQAARLKPVFWNAGLEQLTCAALADDPTRARWPA